MTVRAALSLLGMVPVMALAGCYSMQPVRSALPEPGTDIVVEVTDAGRVALAGTVGPAVSQVEGRLLSGSDQEVVLAVSSVRFYEGGEQVWRGERLSIDRTHVARTFERRFSPGRTATAVAVTLGGAVAFFATRSLIAGGSEPPGPKPGDPGNQLTRPLVGTSP